MYYQGHYFISILWLRGTDEFFNIFFILNESPFKKLR